jgi:hypothetical protein
MAVLQNRKALLGVLGQDEGQEAPDMAGGLDLSGPMAGNTGIAGGMDAKAFTYPQGPGPDVGAPTASPAVTTPEAPDYTKRGKFSTFNATSDKYDRPWDQKSERYKMQTVLSNFDPNQGITPDVIAALNAANINGATFSGSKDKLDARGLKSWENYDGQEGIGDIIEQFNNPAMAGKHTWGAWLPEGGDAGGGQAMGGGAPSMAGIGPTPLGGQLTSGDPLAQIQAALAQYSNSPNIQALLAQLGAGQHG